MFLFLLIVSAIFWNPVFSNVKTWGEECNYADECSDHRMTCKPDIYNISRCDCNKYHEWNGTNDGCIPKYDIDTILNMTVKISDNAGKIENRSQRIYFRHMLAGYFVMCVALISSIIVAIHCLHIKRKDGILKNELNDIRQRVEEAKMKRERHNTVEV